MVDTGRLFDNDTWPAPVAKSSAVGHQVAHPVNIKRRSTPLLFIPPPGRRVCAQRAATTVTGSAQGLSQVLLDNGPDPVPFLELVEPPVKLFDKVLFIGELPVAAVTEEPLLLAKDRPLLEQ